MAKPTPLPEWATSVSAKITEPSTPFKQLGWEPGQRPPAQYMNWWMNNVYKWAKYLDELTLEALTWAEAHVFSKGASGTGVTTGAAFTGVGGSTSGPGVKGTGGASNGAGTEGVGTGTGPGAKGTGGASGGQGGDFQGGASTGVGTGAGVKAVGGLNGVGVLATGGTGNMPGVHGTGSGSGQGGLFTGGPVSGNGINATGGTVSGTGLVGQGGSPNGIGVGGIGAGTGSGGYFTGGATDAPGVTTTGGGTNGTGIVANGVGTGNAIQAGAGHIKLVGGYPASNDAYNNTLTPGNVCQARGTYVVGTGITSGFGVGTPTLPDAETVRIPLATPMANTNYTVLVTLGFSMYPYVFSKSTGFFQVKARNHDGTDNAWSAAQSVNFAVFGEQ